MKAKVPGMADMALDVNLQDGLITAWREPRLLYEAVTEPKTIVPFPPGQGLVNDECLRTAIYLPEWGSPVYAVKAGGVPAKLMTLTPGGQLFPVGIAPPTVAIQFTAGTMVPDRDYDQRSYVYTYTDNAGEESPPSPPSKALSVTDGEPVYLTIPQSTWAINIYRSVTASRVSGDELKLRYPQTAYKLLTTLPPGDETIYEDLVKMKDLGALLATAEHSNPPYLRTLTHVKGTGCLCGSYDNQVWFSEAYEPYNWPAEYGISLPEPVVNLGSLDQWVFVTTSSRAYVIDGMPSCKPRQERQVQDTDQAWPDIGRHHRSSAVTPFGMVYATTEGLALLRQDLTVKILTADWFGQKDWLKIRPETIKLAYWRGRVVIATTEGTWLLEIDNDTFHGYKLGALTELSIRPDDIMVSNNGQLLYLDDNKVWQFNASQDRMVYYWLSSEFFFDGKTAPTVLKLGMDSNTKTVVDFIVGNKRQTLEVKGRDPILRLPRLGRNITCQIGLFGTADISYLELGTALNTISAGA